MEKEPLNQEKILEELENIKLELQAINSHKLIRVYDSITKFLIYSLCRGMMTGLGIAIGSTMLVSVMIYVFTQIELVPILGDWIRLLMEELDLQLPSIE